MTTDKGNSCVNWASHNKSLQLTQQYAVSLRCTLYRGSTEFKRYIVKVIKNIFMAKTLQQCSLNVF